MMKTHCLSMARYHLRAGTLLHAFNPGTRHRGQMSAVITRFGLPVPEMSDVHFLRLDAGVAA